MVKELEDAPRDEAAVVLDARAGLVVGKAPDSSFEMMVRASGSILRRLAADGRRSALVVSGARLERTPVTSLEGDWRVALDQLADRPARRRAARSSRRWRTAAPGSTRRDSSSSPPTCRRSSSSASRWSPAAARWRWCGSTRAPGPTAHRRRASRRASRCRCSGAASPWCACAAATISARCCRPASGARRRAGRAARGGARMTWKEPPARVSPTLARVLPPLALYAAVVAFSIWHLRQIEDPVLRPVRAVGGAGAHAGAGGGARPAAAGAAPVRRS